MTDNKNKVEERQYDVRKLKDANRKETFRVELRNIFTVLEGT